MFRLRTWGAAATAWATVLASAILLPSGTLATLGDLDLGADRGALTTTDFASLGEVDQANAAAMPIDGEIVAADQTGIGGTRVTVGACCVEQLCSIDTAENCTAGGGRYLGDGTDCGSGEAGDPIVYQSSPGIAIPDGGGSANPATDTINVPDVFTVGDVNVDLSVTHTWVGDLTVTLTHLGTTVTILDRPGVPASTFGCGNDNYNGILLDDEGTGGTIEDACTLDLSSPPNYTPNNPLSAFDGMSSAGDWVINVYDSATPDPGTLDRWSVHIDEIGSNPCTGGCVTDSDCDDGDPCTTDVCASESCSNTPISCPLDQICNGGTCVPVGACCVAVLCSIEMAENCSAAGGSYLGDGTDCGSGQAGNPTAYLSSPGIAIPDGGGPKNPAIDTINVPDVFTVGDVDVDLSITHAWVGDLTVTLTHLGTTVTVLARPGVPALTFGCNNDNYNGILLDDEGTGGSIEDACALNLSSPPNYTPNNPLSAFDGMNSSGDWVINVYDSSIPDPGTLDRWSVHIDEIGSNPCACTTDSECDDENNCTDDICNAGTCENPNTAAGTACFTDGNDCTDDVCDGNGNCGVNNTDPCDDLMYCNGADTCSGGSCSTHAGDPCAGGAECADTCDEGAQTCHTPAGAPCTDDGNPCTDNECDGAGNCAAHANTDPCNDGDACTTGDVCQGDAAGTCAGTDTSAADCDDGIDCTIDTCDPTNGCDNAPALEDEDGDGVADCVDACLGTPPGEPIGRTGCSCDQLGLGRAPIEDADEDSIPNECDNCPDVANTDQADSDGDAIGDACDECDGNDLLIGLPCDSPIDLDNCETGIYDCPSGTLSCTDDDATDDSDGDGVCDADDVCPGFDDNIDTDHDRVPDGCDACPGFDDALDCDADGTPDGCEIDCQPNGVPDDCDIADGSSSDNDANGIPDECEAAALLPAAPPHDRATNRYISFNPNNPDRSIAIAILLPDGRIGWVDTPQVVDWVGLDPSHVSLVVDAPVFRAWNENTVHVAGCAIAPDETYELSTSMDGETFAAPLSVQTVPAPIVGSWADVVGVFDNGPNTWTPPNGFVNFNDIDAVVKKFQVLPTAPHVTVVDLHPQWPNYLVNFSDIGMAVNGFQSVAYPVPLADCQTIANCPLGDVAPCLP